MRKTGAVAALCGAVALMCVLVASATGFVGTGGVATARDSHTSATARAAAALGPGQLESVGPSQLSLRIGYFAQWGRPSVCPMVGPKATVMETAASVTVTARQVPLEDCRQYIDLIPHPGSLVVRLMAPLGGRSVLGLSIYGGAFSHAGGGSWDPQPSIQFPLRLHSVIGLSPADAMVMLTRSSVVQCSPNQYCDPFCPNRCGKPPIVNIVVKHARQPECSLPVVVGQQPAPGAVIRKQGSRVVLLVAPALAPCGPGSCQYRGC